MSAIEYVNTNYGDDYRNDWELERVFNEWLDEVYEPVEVVGLTLPTSRVLQECDPIAWREFFNNWLDEFGWTEV